VVGYVAELQQLDTFDAPEGAPASGSEASVAEAPAPVAEAPAPVAGAPAPAADPAPPATEEPAADPGTAVTIPPSQRHAPIDDDTDEFLISWAAFTASTALLAATDAPAAPAAKPAPRVTGGARRRLRVAVFSFAALAFLVAAGVGYAALNQTPARDTALPPRVQAPTQPLDPDPTFTTGAVPGLDRARLAPPASASGTPSASATAGAPATSRPAGSGSGIGSGGAVPAPVPTDPVDWPETPPVQQTPPVTRPPTRPPYVPPAPPTDAPADADLTASVERADDMVLGLGGYAATVRIANPGRYAVTGWTVTLTVPNGKKIRQADGATVAQHRGEVVFTPSGNATVPAGGSVSFSFEVKGLLPGDLTGCTIDGRPCT
jgi:hypothetical protein